MAENRTKYPAFLHVTMFFMALILSGFGITGYLSYGDKTCQIVTQNLRGDIAIVLQVFLFIGVLFTYPLQIYPNIQIVEHLCVKFRRWNISRRRRSQIMNRPLVNNETESLISDESQDASMLQVKSLKVSSFDLV